MGSKNHHVEVDFVDAPDKKDVPFWCSARLALAILGFFGFVNMYAVRVNLSVAIVCMVNRTGLEELTPQKNVTTTITEDTEHCVALNSTEDDLADGNLLWDKKVQGLVLGSYFWGYLISQVLAGWVATKIGGKRVFGWSMFASGVLTLFTPVLSDVHYGILMALRIVLGMAGGVTFPAMHSMWGNWAPPLERTKLASFTYAGAQVGNVVTFPLAGFLCKYGFAGGWPSIFYVLGALTIVWFILWMLLVSDYPSQHRRISEVERNYIMYGLRETIQADHQDIKVPWLSIATSLPVYAIIVSNISSDWGAYTLMTNIPTYMNDVLKFDIASNGLYSALPYIAFWLFINVAGWLADFLRKRKILSTTVTRKAFDSFGKLVPALMLVGLGFVECTSPGVALLLLTLGVCLTGFQFSGFVVNHVDIAPPFAGILFGISNSIGAVTGFLSPYVVGVLTNENSTRPQWQIVFFIAAGFYAVGALFYIIFASGELQPWAQLHETSRDEENDSMVKLQSINKTDDHDVEA